jgi:hypothetical protein
MPKTLNPFFLEQKKKYIKNEEEENKPKLQGSRYWSKFSRICKNTQA